MGVSRGIRGNITCAGVAEDTLSTSIWGRVPIAKQAELHIRRSIGIVCNLSQCLSQIQEEAAAPPDGISHVSRKTQTLACFDRWKFFLTMQTVVFPSSPFCW